MGEVLYEAEFGDYEEVVDFPNRGVMNLEVICSAFFGSSLGVSSESVDNPIVRSYGLFDINFSFIYGRG